VIPWRSRIRSAPENLVGVRLWGEQQEGAETKAAAGYLMDAGFVSLNGGLKRQKIRSVTISSGSSACPNWCSGQTAGATRMGAPGLCETAWFKRTTKAEIAALVRQPTLFRIGCLELRSF
jgi:hypothetical protein